MLQLGVDRLKGHLEGKRAGLITNPTGLDSRMCSTIDILHQMGVLKALFSPEHGVRGDQDAGAIVETYTDFKTGVPVYSLYRKDTKRLTAPMLDGLDALVFDIQDVGARYYTYLYTMRYALEDAAKAGLPFYVLDRPNPLGGEKVQGNVLNSAYGSFIGGYPLAMRYGLTIGEFAAMLNDELHLGAQLYVIGMAGWQRDMLFSQLHRPWIAPSLNMPSFETALLYPGMCLIEGTELSEGRGTAMPFKTIGAPYINAEALAWEMNGKQIDGLHFLPAYFTPCQSKHQNERCQGVCVTVTDYECAKPIDAAIHLILQVRDMYPDDFRFREPVRQGGRSMIELLCGDSVQLFDSKAEDILISFAAQSEAFQKRKQVYHLY